MEDDCLQIGKPSWYITNTKINSPFYPSGVGKSSTGLFGCGYGEARSPDRVADNIVWLHMADEDPYLYE